MVILPVLIACEANQVFDLSISYYTDNNWVVLVPLRKHGHEDLE